MLTVAYLANQFPVAVEPYVVDEIRALRSRGVRVVAASVSRTKEIREQEITADVVLHTADPFTVLRGLWVCVRSWGSIAPLVWRVLTGGRESPVARLKAVVHTVLGACFAVQLQAKSIDHIHAHHGFSASWIALVASRLLGIDFSMTLHGSDLLLHETYLDVKLQECSFCFTISDYNRRFISTRYSKVTPEKIVVSRLGVDIRPKVTYRLDERSKGPFRILAVGRLHWVKDHAFLVRACAQLHKHDFPFECQIAGDGPERNRLQSLIQRYQLQERVRLFGHADKKQLDRLYTWADLVVLTSRSEGIPLVLMEAMAHGKVVLAPRITGIPELVIAGHTGFLYQAGSMNDFLAKLSTLCSLSIPQSEPMSPTGETPQLLTQRMDWIRHASRLHVEHNFNRQKNLNHFCDLFLERVAPASEESFYEGTVLQQV